MKIYTKTGDSGETGLFGGGRVSKDHPRVEAYGTVDELNAVLGVCIRDVQDEVARDRLRRLQHDLFTIGAELATPPPRGEPRAPERPRLPEARISEMEQWIDEATERTEPLREFVLPGGTVGAAALHVARTVCRRAERSVVALERESPVDPLVVRYLNRLSDLLFSLARLENHAFGDGDVTWSKEG